MEHPGNDLKFSHQTAVGDTVAVLVVEFAVDAMVPFAIDQNVDKRHEREVSLVRGVQRIGVTSDCLVELGAVRPHASAQTEMETSECRVNG